MLPCYVICISWKNKNIARNLLSLKTIPGRTELEGLRNLKNKIEDIN